MRQNTQEMYCNSSLEHRITQTGSVVPELPCCCCALFSIRSYRPASLGAHDRPGRLRALVGMRCDCGREQWSCGEGTEVWSHAQCE